MLWGSDLKPQFQNNNNNSFRVNLNNNKIKIKTLMKKYLKKKKLMRISCDN